jgi:hypothetical protein
MFSSINTFAGAFRNSKQNILSNAPQNLAITNLTNTSFTVTFTQPTTGTAIINHPVTTFTTTSLGTSSVSISFTQS